MDWQTLFANFTYWHWIALGSALWIFEILIGSGYFFWIGLGSLSNAYLVFFIPKLDILLQVGIFLLVAAFLIAAWRILKPKWLLIDRELPDSRQYIDSEFELTSAIKYREGTIVLDDFIWHLRCRKNLPQGTRVKVYAVDGVILKVQATS
ncbi:MAG: NfeD family protein [Gammaproteobacteria bacterium]